MGKIVGEGGLRSRGLESRAFFTIEFEILVEIETGCSVSIKEKILDYKDKV